jgi:hypothetical protein
VAPGDQAGLEVGPSQDFREGFFIGILVAQGHFGGDGKQPQVTLRMHTKHEALLEWVETAYPGGKVYGPYHHSGRSYYQWMARGPYLRHTILPLLSRHMSPDLDGDAWGRYQTMLRTYKLPGAPRPLAPGGTGR